MKYLVIAYTTDLSAKKQMQFNRMFKGYRKFDKRMSGGGKEYVHEGLLEGKDVKWIGAGIFIIDVDFGFMRGITKKIMELEIFYSVCEIKDVSTDFLWLEGE
jgi:hypothetical protein